MPLIQLKSPVIIGVLFTLFFSQNLFSQTEENKEPEKKATSGPGLGISLMNHRISAQLYSDFAYAVGPQKQRRYYDYITRDTLEDFGRRDYTSFPLYTNQFSLAYSYLQLQYDFENKLRFRFAVHAGSIVEALYFEEMPSVRKIRELAALYYITPKLALEAGIFPSYFGAEIVLNKENLHATRGYIADFTPDYEAGARLHWYATEKSTFRAMMLNGWQQIREGNGRKALALGWSYNNPKKVVGDWHMYFGDERFAYNSPNRIFRYYSNSYARIWIGASKKLLILPVFDFMVQEKPGSSGTRFDWVTAPALSVRYAVHEKFGVAARYDRIWNPGDVIPELFTGLPIGWRSNSGTFTLEYLPSPQVTFRSEFRYTMNDGKVFRDKDDDLTKLDYYFIVSMAIHIQ